MLLEIKNLDENLITSAFKMMQVSCKRTDISQLIDCFILIDVDCISYVGPSAMIHIPLAKLTTKQFDQIKSILIKQSIKQANFV